MRQSRGSLFIAESVAEQSVRIRFSSGSPVTTCYSKQTSAPRRRVPALEGWEGRQVASLAAADVPLCQVGVLLWLLQFWAC